ncbi:MAG: tetratricopeptide repeat protein, partial [Tannerellaceae bacterium]|nr:tetratricopeptide repeat protein [Tannerellaceae bacterium]
IRELDEKLAELRIAYTEGNRARKEQLAASILEAEDQLNRLLEQPDGLERKARNAEINYLKINR